MINIDLTSASIAIVNASTGRGAATIIVMQAGAYTFKAENVKVTGDETPLDLIKSLMNQRGYDVSPAVIPANAWEVPGGATGEAFFIFAEKRTVVAAAEAVVSVETETEQVAEDASAEETKTETKRPAPRKTKANVTPAA